jgi:Mismatch repair ATPase (MutS family)
MNASTAHPASPPGASQEVESEYERRLADRRTTEAALSRRADRVGNVRLAVFLLGAILAYFAIFPQTVSAWWLTLPGAAFLALVIHHDRLLKARDRAGRAAAFYEQGLRRLRDEWAGTGNPGDRFADPAHPYAADLDLFGHGSLFELLCTARTRMGENTLADWLRAPADAAETIWERQAAVGELRDRLDLREDIAVLGAEVRAGKRRAGVDADALAAWAEAPPVPVPGSAERYAVLGGAAALGLAAVGAWIAGRGLLPLVVMVPVLGFLSARWRRSTEEVLAPLEQAARDLELLAGLLARLEREMVSSPMLSALHGAIAGGEPASAAISRLNMLLDLRDAERNPFFAPLAFLLLWRVQSAAAVENWRRSHGPHVAAWLAAAGEWEAVAALAGYAHEHPDAPFPEILPDGSPPAFEATGLAHPLLPRGGAVPNDVAFGGPNTPKLLMVSGSNMSGKSTLLRAVGTNAVLAMAGAPVRAKHLRLTRVAIGASLRTQDSLQSGVSRFYAEISRLKQVTDLAEGAGRLPLLFLLDEVLSGTNSHDRRIGAEAILRGLVARGAIGLATTHDLALTEIANDPALQAVNVHLQDHLDDAGTLAFDYRLQPGVVTRSNALALMRAVGLDIR